MSDMEEKETSTDTNKKIEVVTGNGNLNISPVYRHLEVEKPKAKDSNKKIFIPEVKNTPSNRDKNSQDDNPMKTTLTDDSEDNIDDEDINNNK